VPSKSALRFVSPSKGYGWAKARSLASLLAFKFSPGESYKGHRYQNKGHHFYKSVQILAFADDTDIIGRSEDDIKKSFMALKTAGDALGQRAQEEKTKYMIVNGKKIYRIAESYVKITGYRSERDL
jgi:hypothetical protein